jgi:hypothetical protein
MQTDYYFSSVPSSVQFTPTFFQASDQLPLLDTPQLNAIQQISYTPEQYGSLAAFLQHPDCGTANEQYIQIFRDIGTFIGQYCRTSEPIQASFFTFLIAILDGTFISRQTLLYGEGKELLRPFMLCSCMKKLRLEKKLAAVNNLAEELHACADGAINSLIVMAHHLLWPSRQAISP